MKTQDRTKDIQVWLNSIYSGQKIDLKEIAGDASFRKYFRLLVTDSNNVSQNSYIVMDAPPAKEPIRPFINSTQILREANIAAPQIFHKHIEKGFLVLDDFGSSDCLSKLSMSNADNYYKKAIDVMLNIQKIPNHNNLPKFDEQQIRLELNLFSQWFLHEHCHIAQHELDEVFDFLISSITSQPYLVAHRDFHSRNLMVLDDDSIGILDHQDLMIGPATYDLVSLLKDCYIDWPSEKVNAWLSFYEAHSPLKIENLHTAFNLTGLQRHMKALGIFTRQAYLYDNPSYLQYLPRVLKYIQQVADNISELKTLSRLIKKVK